MPKNKTNEYVLVRNDPNLTKHIKGIIKENIKTCKRLRNLYTPEETIYNEVYYIINWKYLITLYYDKQTGERMERINIEDYNKRISEQKAFGRRVEHIAVICKVPWNIAELVGHIVDDNTALQTIEQIKKAKLRVTIDIRHNLILYNESALNTIKELLGDELFSMLKIPSKHHLRNLAFFLCS